MPRKAVQKSKRISVTDPLTGQRHQPRVYGKNATELRDREAAKRAEILSGGFVEPERMTVAAWCRQWHATYHRAGATMHTRDVIIRNHIADDPIGAIQLGKLRPLHVQQWIDRKAATYRRNTISGMIATLGMALDRAVRLGIIASDPCAGVELPRTPRRPFQVWDESQVRRYLDTVRDEPLAALWTLAVTLGIRRGELLALSWDDVDWQAGTLSIQRTITRDADGRWHIGALGKTAASRRTLPLGATCLASLRTHRSRQQARRMEIADVWLDSGAVFDDGLGGYLPTPNALASHHRRIIAASGLPRIRIHDLRHTAATVMLTRGVPLILVSGMLGHANPSITAGIYGHVIPQHLSDATDVIDRLFGS